MEKKTACKINNQDSLAIYDFYSLNLVKVNKKHRFLQHI